MMTRRGSLGEGDSVVGHAWLARREEAKRGFRKRTSYA